MSCQEILSMLLPLVKQLLQDDEGRFCCDRCRFLLDRLVNDTLHWNCGIQESIPKSDISDIFRWLVNYYAARCYAFSDIITFGYFHGVDMS